MTETQDTGKEFADKLASMLSAKLSATEGLDLFVENFAAAFTEPPSARYNDEFFFDILKPVIITLIRFKDDTAKELRHLKGFIAEKDCRNDGTDYAVEILESTLERIDDILLGYDVQPFRCEEEKFNPRRQNAVKKLTADSPGQVKTVAESLSDGYERKGCVISRERVAAYSAELNAGEES